MRRERSRRRSLIKVGILAIVAVSLLVGVYQGGRWLETRSQKKEERGDYTQRYADSIVEIDGIPYLQNKNITTILLMGIDKGTESANVSGYRNGGQADFLRLLVIDKTEKKTTQIQIDRDTMTPITVLGVLGNKSGMRTAQISLSHGFGDGKKQSCELTVEAVSNMMLGIPIDFYVAMNLDGIATLNDFVGGVTVTIEDDFSAIDPTMLPGTTMTLAGDQAEAFVRSRSSVGSGTNKERMARQEQYVSQLVDKLSEQASNDKEFIGTLYDVLTPYLITDMNRGRMINEVWAAKDYEQTASIKPDGVHTIGSDGFMQFYMDEAAMKQTVIGLFYEEMK